MVACGTRCGRAEDDGHASVARTTNEIRNPLVHAPNFFRSASTASSDFFRSALWPWFDALAPIVNKRGGETCVRGAFEPLGVLMVQGRR